MSGSGIFYKRLGVSNKAGHSGTHFTATQKNTRDHALLKNPRFLTKAVYSDILNTILWIQDAEIQFISLLWFIIFI